MCWKCYVLVQRKSVQNVQELFLHWGECNILLYVLDVSILTRATVVRARFLAAAFSDGSYLAHVNGAYLRHVTFCIVRDPLCSSSRLSLSVGPLAYAARCPLTVPGWSKVHDGDFEGVEQTCSRIQPASHILAVMWWAAFFDKERPLSAAQRCSES